MVNLFQALTFRVSEFVCSGGFQIPDLDTGQVHNSGFKRF